MTDLQETLNPVNNTGANPPENSLESNPLVWNPWDVQTNSFAEQPEILNQPQEIISEQPVSSVAPNLSNIPENVATGTSLTANTPINASESISQNANNLPDTQEMINAAKKEKLAQLLKAECDKWKKSWLVKWILLWIGTTLWILVVSVVLAKEQIISLLSNNLNLPSIEANVTNITSNNTNIKPDEANSNDENPTEDEILTTEENEDNVKEINEISTENNEIPTEIEDISTIEEWNFISEDENNDTENSNEIEENLINNEENDEIFEKYYLQIEDIIESDINNEEKLSILEQLQKEILSTTPQNEALIKYFDQKIIEIYDQISQNDNNKEIEHEENTDNSSENEINDEVNEDTNNSNSKESEDKNSETPNTDKWYTIIHVNSEEEANWVLTANCNDLTCYGEDKEFSPCTSFRLAENLDENAHRIGNGWACRYKNKSELVYVQFN